MAAPLALPARRRSIFPPIPAPLQRLFDLVPLVVYPANALPGDDAYDHDHDHDHDNSTSADLTSPLPTLFVFIDPADASRGRASFNPTCLKWQAFLRFAGVPVRLVASSNHASPTGALPFLQPPRQPEPASDVPASKKQARHRTRLPPPPRPVPTSDFAKYAGRTKTAAALPADSLAAVSPRAPAYQALLDTSLRRAWLHAVYLDDGGSSSRPGQASIASRLYADAASSSMVVRAALTGQLQTAAASEVWGAAATATPSATAVAQIYRDAEVALSALSTVLDEDENENENDDDDDDDEKPLFFFGSKEPTIFDAAVFSYTHLLLEEDDDEEDGVDTKRFRWRNTTLPDLVKAHPRLVQHRNDIVARYWPAAEGEAGPAEPDSVPPAAAAGSEATTAAPDTSSVADSVSWVRV